MSDVDQASISSSSTNISSQFGSQLFDFTFLNDEIKLDNFIKTDDNLFTNIDSLFEKNQCIFIHGRSGTGKTRLAREYANNLTHTTQNNIKIIFIDTTSSLSCNLIKLKNLLDIIPENLENDPIDENYLLQLIKTKIDNQPKHKKILFIFDNVQELKYVTKLLENINSNHKIIITTKNESLRMQINDNVGIVEVKPFNERMCNRYLDKNKNKLLDDLTLVEWREILLSSSENNTNTQTISISVKLLELLVNNFNSHRKWGVKNCKDYLLNHSNFRYELIRKEDKNVYEILKHLAYLNGSCIELEIVQKLWKSLYARKQKEGQKEFEKSLSYLLKNAYLKKKMDSNKKLCIYEMHELIQSEIRLRLDVIGQEGNKAEIMDRLALVLNQIVEINDEMTMHISNITNRTRFYENLNDHLFVLIEEKWKSKLTNPNYLDLLRKMAFINRKLFSNHKTAMEFYKKIQNIHNERSTPPNDLSIGILKNDMGIVNFEMKLYEEALRNLNDSLRIKRLRLASNDPKIASTLNNIGQVYHREGKLENALEYYNESLRMFKEVYDRNDVRIGKIITNIGRVYFELGNSDETLKHYLKALNILENSSNMVDSNAIEDLMIRVGKIYHAKAKYEEALKYYNKSLGMLRNVLGSNGAKVEELLEGIGQVYWVLGKHDEALRCFKEIRDIYRPHANWSFKIGKLYLEMGKYDEALTSFEEALDFLKKENNDCEPNNGSIWFNIGKVYYGKADLDLALEYFKKSSEILRNDLEFGDVQFHIGCIYLEKKSYDEALCVFSRLLKLSRQFLRPSEPFIGDITSKIGKIYVDQGKYEEALRFYYIEELELEREEEEASATKSESIGRTLSNVAEVYMLKKQYDQAYKYSKESVDIFRDLLIQSYPKWAGDSLFIIGVVYQHRQNYYESLKHFEEALEIYKKLPLKSDDHTIKTVSKLISEVNEAIEIEKMKENIDKHIIGKVFNQKYKVEKKLGSGASGHVYLVYDEYEKINKAMKMISRVHYMNEYFSEIRALKTINSEYIIKYYEQFQHDVTNSCIITEYCENGDLANRIKVTKENGKQFSEDQIISWTIQITCALKQLHNNPQKFIHRDIKPSNIFLTGNDRVKLGDLGCVRSNSSEKLISTLAGTTPYMSPEVLKRQYSCTTDIWSLGCVLYELITLEMAFPNGPNIDSPLPDLKMSPLFIPILKK